MSRIPINPKVNWSLEDIPNADIQRKRIWEMIEKWTGHPTLVEWSAKLIKKYDVPERNDKALAEAILDYAQKYIKFFRERPERFVNPLRTIAMGIGDCDDKTIFIATILRTYRIPVRLVFLRFLNQSTSKYVSHVFPEAYINNKWQAMESVHAWPLGDNPIDRMKRKGIKYTVNYIGDTV